MSEEPDRVVPEIGDIQLLSDGNYGVWNGHEWQTSGEALAKVEYCGQVTLVRVWMNPLGWGIG